MSAKLAIAAAGIGNRKVERKSLILVETDDADIPSAVGIETTIKPCRSSPIRFGTIVDSLNWTSCLHCNNAMLEGVPSAKQPLGAEHLGECLGERFCEPVEALAE